MVISEALVCRLLAEDRRMEGRERGSNSKHKVFDVFVLWHLMMGRATQSR
jgi:hypothetical protein